MLRGERWRGFYVECNYMGVRCLFIRRYWEWLREDDEDDEDEVEIGNC